MRWEQAEELRADPAAGPSGRKSVPVGQKRSFWPALVVTAATVAFGGVLWYAYQEGRSTSASGEPPLIKADQGPVKVKPDQPGGENIPFQDSTVYDRLGQNGNGKQPPMEKLLPPPETPVQLPQPAPAPQSPPQSAPAAAPPANTDAAALAPKAEGLPVVVTTGVQPAAPQPEAKPSPAQSSAPPSAANQADPIGALAAAALAKPEISKNAAATPNATLSSSYRIQLSAVRTEEAVAPEWARLKRHFPDLLSSLKMEATKSEVPGKGTFYRIEAGPLDLNGAKAACEHVKAQGVGCFVIKLPR
ncbi:MAG TPA: SPOR domain-containing protein [Alphaproteobacteria bacterium]|nr:SPOR domain-containing protein [Alphaproteobacteria bacterium]